MTHEVIASRGVGSRDGDAPASGGCACGEDTSAGLPELDARTIPHVIRHDAILGALDGVAPGDGLVLVAPHDPRGLLSQLEQRMPDAFEIEYLESGPDAWRLSLIRKDA